MGAITGLTLALLGLIPTPLPIPPVFGAGYPNSRALLQDIPAFHFDDSVLAYLPLKLIATILFAVSGLPGGLFAPNLAIGIGAGYSFSRLLAESRIVGTVSSIAVLLVGSTSYFAGATQSPLTSFLIVRDTFGLDSRCASSRLFLSFTFCLLTFFPCSELV